MPLHVSTLLNIHLNEHSISDGPEYDCPSIVASSSQYQRMRLCTHSSRARSRPIAALSAAVALALTSSDCTALVRQSAITRPIFRSRRMNPIASLSSVEIYRNGNSLINLIPPPALAYRRSDAPFSMVNDTMSIPQKTLSPSQFSSEDDFLQNLGGSIPPHERYPGPTAVDVLPLLHSLSRGLQNQNTSVSPKTSRPPSVVPLDDSLALEAATSMELYFRARFARRSLRQNVNSRSKVLEGYSDEMKTSMERGFKKLLSSGLTAFDVASVLVHTPAVSTGLSNGPEDIMILLTKTLGLRRYDARKVIRNCPGILTHEGATRAISTIEFLHRGLGLSLSSIRNEKASTLPSLISRDSSDLFRLVAFMTSEDVRMNLDSIGPMLKKREAARMLDAVSPSPYELVSEVWWNKDGSPYGVKKVKLSEATTKGINWGRSKGDLVAQTYSKMGNVAQTLQKVVSQEDFHKIIVSYPDALMLDPSTQVLPVINFLHFEVGLVASDIRRVLQSFPTVLGIPVLNMKERIQFLDSLGIHGDNLCKIIRAFPHIMTLDVETRMMPVVEFLKSIGIENVGRFVSRLPPVLGYSVENELLPKW
eukprot:CAMPEP_0113308666 /NCGR_PEP_ID=MMETSP0010_2-20120614/7022_1 /TAXON_ID=216773 ORGANISM="Corethron hystrix, Strain 308" /NCGR_SAMPLE_ID=MMETSP0010_2 /ASSEMBLY_ACC=CAM_ASM_000155 /LENGTH=590 /DNA_ID=CAMNT_0000163771 /DNA_START=264 /DNA_END=2033 /DNA_ORIENTATION=- /assembly_acc=CAM_ASM_000155